MKKIFPVILLGILLLVPGFAKATELTIEQRIANIREQIAVLQNQLLLLQSGQNTSSGSTNPNQACVDLHNDFYLYSSDRTTNGEVSKLQNFLRSRSESLWPGIVPTTGFFGLVTQKALSNFQLDHALFTSTFARGTGKVDAQTRAYIKDATCSETQPPTPNTYQIEVMVVDQVECFAAPCYPVAVPSANVSILKNGALITNGITNSSGSFKAASLQAGTYTINVSKTGFTSGTQTVIVANANVSTQIILDRTSDTNQNTPIITWLQPTSGPTGTTVTVYGSNFTSTGNKIKFGNLGSELNPAYSLNSADGHTLTFTVPYWNYYACFNSTPACTVATMMTAPGTYDVSVINANGISNSMPFVVSGTTSQQPTISILQPVSSATWQIGSTQTLAWNTQNMPSGAVIIFSLTGGQTTPDLKVLINPAGAGDTSTVIPLNFIQGDTGVTLLPGTYHVTATMYDKMPCRALCNPADTSHILAHAESSAIITVTAQATDLTPTVTLTASPSSGVAPITVYFSATLTNSPSCLGYGFDYGDGMQSEVSPSCQGEEVNIPSRTITSSETYSYPGVYTVTFGANGLTKSVIVTITGSSNYVRGDVSMNGSIDLADYVLVSGYVNGTRSLTADQIILADYNSDNIVNINDANAIRTYLLSIGTSV